jgi:hypothetical protein
MWEKYMLGTSRPVIIPGQLMRAIDKYKEKTGVQNPEVFDTALLKLWNIWNGGKQENSPCDQKAVQDVANKLRYNPPPQSRDKDKDTIWISFKGEMTFKWVQTLEQDYAIVRCTEDFIRRLLTWFLKEERFL